MDGRLFGEGWKKWEGVVRKKVACQIPTSQCTAPHTAVIRPKPSVHSLLGATGQADQVAESERHGFLGVDDCATPPPKP